MPSGGIPDPPNARIKFRRGEDEFREDFIPELGEPIFAEDTGHLYMGDGVTPGGLHVARDASKLVEGTVPNARLSANLSAISALATQGLVTRTGTGTAAARTLTAGTGISVTNGNGASGNPTVALSQAGILSTDAGVNALAPTHSFIQINLSIGNTTINLASGSLPVGFSVWAAIINNSGTNQLTFDAGSGNTIHAPGVFSQTWALSTSMNASHRWFKIIKFASTLWSIDTGVSA